MLQFKVNDNKVKLFMSTFDTNYYTLVYKEESYLYYYDKDKDVLSYMSNKVMPFTCFKTININNLITDVQKFKLIVQKIEEELKEKAFNVLFE